MTITDDTCFYLNTVSVDSVNKFQSWVVPITVNRNIVPMKVDTGAETNVLSESDFRNLKGVKLHEANEKLRSYTGDSLDIMGKCVLPVQSGTESVNLYFIYAERQYKVYSG